MQTGTRRPQGAGVVPSIRGIGSVMSAMPGDERNARHIRPMSTATRTSPTTHVP